MFSDFKNLNLLLKREHQYHETGRLQTLEEAKSIYAQIEEILKPFEYQSLQTQEIEEKCIPLLKNVC